MAPVDEALAEDARVELSAPQRERLEVERGREAHPAAGDGRVRHHHRLREGALGARPAGIRGGGVRALGHGLRAHARASLRARRLAGRRVAGRRLPGRVVGGRLLGGQHPRERRGRARGARDDRRPQLNGTADHPAT
jgi:hypothetical protein